MSELGFFAASASRGALPELCDALVLTAVTRRYRPVAALQSVAFSGTASRAAATRAEWKNDVRSSTCS
jgi:hypothetical protein